MQIALRYSRKLACFFVMLYLCAIMSIWSAYVPWWLKILLFIACLFSFIQVMRHHVWLNIHNAVIKIVLDDHQKWQLVRSNSDAVQVDLQGDTVVLPFGMVLNFKEASRRVSVLLCPDSVQGDQYRQLCVRLRSGRLTG